MKTTITRVGNKPTLYKGFDYEMVYNGKKWAITGLKKPGRQFRELGGMKVDGVREMSVKFKMMLFRKIEKGLCVSFLQPFLENIKEGAVTGLQMKGGMFWLPLFGMDVRITACFIAYQPERRVLGYMLVERLLTDDASYCGGG